MAQTPALAATFRATSIALPTGGRALVVRTIRHPAMPLVVRREPWFLWDFRRVGGLRFLKVGRLSVSWCVSRGPFRPIGAR